jgi:hypothetical protein
VHDIWERLHDSVAVVVTALRAATWSAPADWRVVGVEEIDVNAKLERRYLEELRGRDTSRVVEAVRSTRKWSPSKKLMKAGLPGSGTPLGGHLKTGH